MLSFIIPPLVIILALVGLFFLFSRRVAQERLAGSSVVAPDVPQIIREGKLHQYMRTFVRFPVHAIRWIFQKIAAVFMRWRKRRQSDAPLRMTDMPSLSPSDEGEENITRLPDITIHSRSTLVRSREIQRMEAISAEPKLPRHPMVTEAVTQPEMSRQDLLEEELINRIATHPQDIEAYERLGDHYAERDARSDAMECFKQVLKLSPGNHRARLMLQKFGKKNF
ncbi:MAG TPA: hypothetical protein VJL38_02280 [Patescibacteria group bacterium]|nr:hypothetical protein [Patescibacteria group bacterium]